MAVQVTCNYCSYQWPYKGNRVRACCPRCKRKSRINAVAAPKALTIPAQIPSTNVVQLGKNSEGIRNGPPVPDSTRFSQGSNEAAPPQASAPAEPEKPQELTDELIDKIAGLMERSIKSKDENVGELNIEKILLVSPNPEGAIKAYEKYNLVKERLRLMEKYDYRSMSIEDKLAFCETIDWKEEAQRLKIIRWYEWEKAWAYNFMLLDIARRQGKQLDSHSREFIPKAYEEFLNEGSKLGLVPDGFISNAFTDFTIPVRHISIRADPSTLGGKMTKGKP